MALGEELLHILDRVTAIMIIDKPKYPVQNEDPDMYQAIQNLGPSDYTKIAFSTAGMMAFGYATGKLQISFRFESSKPDRSSPFPSNPITTGKPARVPNMYFAGAIGLMGMTFYCAQSTMFKLMGYLPSDNAKSE